MHILTLQHVVDRVENDLCNDHVVSYVTTYVSGGIVHNFLFVPGFSIRRNAGRFAEKKRFS